MSELAPGISTLKLLLLFFAGLVQREQGRTIEYLGEENRILRQQLGKRRLRLTGDQRRRLAVKGEGARPTPARAGGHAGDAGYDPGVASGLDRSEVDPPAQAGGPPRTPSGDPRADRAHGSGQPILGLLPH
ncbi:MAG: hypothetical protein CMJ47_02005, partial [Planctomyces sp.]|nr:hypothetical protein [Planctomyces sp.]